jgi:hypothetical protein
MVLAAGGIRERRQDDSRAGGGVDSGDTHCVQQQRAQSVAYQ